MKEGKFRLGTGKKFLSVRVVRPWHRLPKESVPSPFLEMLNVELDRALEQPDLVEGIPARERRVGMRWSLGDSQHKQFCDSLI